MAGGRLDFRSGVPVGVGCHGVPFADRGVYMGMGCLLAGWGALGRPPSMVQCFFLARVRILLFQDRRRRKSIQAIKHKNIKTKDKKQLPKNLSTRKEM